MTTERLTSSPALDRIPDRVAVPVEGRHSAFPGLRPLLPPPPVLTPIVRGRHINLSAVKPMTFLHHCDACRLAHAGPIEHVRCPVCGAHMRHGMPPHGTYQRVDEAELTFDAFDRQTRGNRESGGR